MHQDSLPSEDESLRFDESSGLKRSGTYGSFNDNGNTKDPPTPYEGLKDNKGTLSEMWDTYKASEPTDPMQLWQEDKSLFWKEMLKRCPYYFFPILLWLPDYKWREQLLPDVITGIGVACMLIPQCLAYALLAEVPPAMGLYTAWSPIIVYFCMSTSKHASIGPDALSSLLVGLYISSSNVNMTSEELAPVFSILCGILLLIFGTFRLGFLDNVLSRPLLSGFVNAVAVIILIEQLNPFFGLPASEHHLEYSWEKLEYTFTHFHLINWTAFLTGVLCLLIMILTRVLKYFFLEKVPILKFLIDTLLVVILGVVLSVSLDFEGYGVKILGHYESEFPIPRAPQLTWGSIGDAIGPSVVMCIIGFVESIVAVKIYAAKHNYQISPNRELVALGASNIVGSFFKAYPTFISLTRSSIADSMGAQSQIYALVASFIVLLAIFVGSEFFYYLPNSAMSAIIVVAAFSLFELEDLHFLWKIKAWRDIALLAFTFLITVILGVDQGIFISIGISLLMIVKHTTLPNIAILGKDSKGSWVDVYGDKKAKVIPGVLVVRIEEGLYFGNIGQLKAMFKRIEKFGTHFAHPTDSTSDTQTLKAIIIHTKGVVGLDASAVQVLSEMVEEYHHKNIFVGFVKLRAQHKEKFLLSGNFFSFLSSHHLPFSFLLSSHDFHQL
eukprot:TRINITY_DN5346_c0_g1_i1.p1 TRINITY_DN5346_c0_g1~~TRINITY_DN5346_c0_g1_i1.p1  ORF type:complete len:667 (-),score=90.75 TRINITY_DN5346_c0_g1_i1:295-2295(-)